MPLPIAGEPRMQGHHISSWSSRSPSRHLLGVAGQVADRLEGPGQGALGDLAQDL